MTGHTPRLNLYKPGGGSSGLILPDEAADIDKLNGNMDVIDGAVGAKQVTSSTRPSVPFSGQIIKESDTKRTMVYNGATWDQVTPPEQGCILIKPTSVSGGTVSALGAVTFTNVASVRLNGVFTSAYDWYEVEFDIDTLTAQGMTANLSAGGVDNAVGYDHQRNTSIGSAGITTQTLNFGQIIVTVPAVIGRHAGSMRLYGPHLAKATIGNVMALTSANPMTASAGQTLISFLHRSVAAFDGISLSPNSGNMTGTVRVYGHNNG